MPVNNTHPEDSALSAIATSVSESLTQVLHWIFWWNSTEVSPYGLTKAEVTVKLNTDFGMAGMSSQDLQAVVAAWQSGAISRDTMFELFRSGEILPDGRTNEDEKTLIAAGTGANGEHRGQPLIDTNKNKYTNTETKRDAREGKKMGAKI